MSAFSFEQQNELANLFKKFQDSSQGASLLRQLQGFALDFEAGVAFPSYTASNVTALATVTHRRGKEPLAVLATVGNNGHLAHSSGTGTQFSVWAETRDGAAVTGPVGIYYLAAFRTS